MSHKGHLYFAPNADTSQEVESIVDRMHKGESLSQLLPVSRKKVPLLPLVIYSDFEPDDLMTIAQLWQWKAEQIGDECSLKSHRPLVIFCVNFVEKDHGTIFEKKLLMARLMLGLDPRDIPIVTTCDGVFSKDGGSVRHPLAKSCWQGRQDAIGSIASNIAKLAKHHTAVDFHFIAPGHGHIGDILNELSSKYPEASSKLKQTSRLVTYTGSFNTRGHEPNDLQAIQKLFTTSPVVDISKFVFFGRGDCHPITASADSFASPTLAAKLSSQSPLLAAAIVSFNEEFTARLIRPDGDRLFQKKEGVDPLTSEERERFNDTIADVFKSEGVNAYAQALCSDEAIFSKVASYKKSTLHAFANGTCDMPLCDQVCFLYEWAQKECPKLLEYPQGEWWIDPKTGHSGVCDGDHEHKLGVQAIQPVMVNPKDEATLQAFRSALEKYLLRHLSSCPSN